MKTKTRDIVEATPRRELSLFDDMDRMFDSFLTRGWLRPFRELWPEWARFEEGAELRTPRVDVLNRDDEVLVRAELPGVKREDLTVELTGDLLTIRGEHRHEERKEEGDLVRAEIARGTFSRTMTMPAGLDGEHVKAAFKDGVLEVHLPKLEKTERRRIDIA
jgi:HSP20 family protein